MKTRSLTKPLILAINLTGACLPMDDFDDVFRAVDRMHAVRINAPLSDEEMMQVEERGGLDPQLARAKQIADFQARIGGEKEKDFGDSLVGNSVQVIDNNAANVTDGPELVGQPVAILTIETSDKKAAPLVVTLPPPIIQLVSPQQGVTPVCVLDYGIGGAQVSGVEIDWIGGLSFQVVASYLRVYGRLDHYAGVKAGTIATMAAFVGRGPKVRESRLVRSINVGTVTHQSVDNAGGINIPRMATEASLVYEPTTPTSVILFALSTNAQILYKQDIVANKNPMPLVGPVGFSSLTTGAGGSGQVEVFNNDAAVDISASRLVFTIEL